MGLVANLVIGIIFGYALHAFLHRFAFQIIANQYADHVKMLNDTIDHLEIELNKGKQDEANRSV